jgi:diaminohydroxyphosphoribosylaminopyrimidine deaminase/5-amino-6-(5-phosphoribosylamino)uracil reductase
VVSAIEDPDPIVAGSGFAKLRAAGVDVRVGCGAVRVQRQLAAYLHHRGTGRAFCVVKTANSIDGYVAARDGSSQWITAEAARADVHALRADSQAIVVGAGTALADNPTLNVRNLPDDDRVALGAQPLRVLLDAHGRVPALGPLFDSTIAPTLVITTPRADDERVREWQARGAEVEFVDFASAAAGRGVDLDATLSILGSRGVLQAMVEGGAALHGALLAANLVDQLTVYVGNTLLGSHGLPTLAHDGPTTINDARRWGLVSARVIGDDVRLDYQRSR